MIKQIDIICKYRLQLKELSYAWTLERLNEIHPGFKNIIIWHMGHLLVTLPGMCYRPAGIAMPVENALWHDYKPGTVSGEAVDAIGIND